MTIEIQPGRIDPLGATWDGSGVNFCLYARQATGVDLCLFESTDGPEAQRLPLTPGEGYLWHGYVAGIGPGRLYGYRVSGPYAPERGCRFNPNKLLLDPYARAIAGRVRWDGSVFDHVREGASHGLIPDTRDSAPRVPKSVVIDPGGFDWQGDRPPRVAKQDTIIYETHVKGLTMRHPEVPAELRGTYAGLASDPVLRYFTSLGVTAVELLPVHEILDEPFLHQRGLVNYWGYESIGFFAPTARYAGTGDRGAQVDEFKAMVRRLHAAGLEVILDVVYNHTGEGGRLGPTICFRGIDNATYYLLDPAAPGQYLDDTGTGNTVHVQNPPVLKLIMDSLRYWVEEMHVDGFRFDLATTLGRDPDSFDRTARFFDIVYQDPVLSRVKLIAEPWDVGAAGYEVGQFPVHWSEWNGKFRDTVRRFWRGNEGQIGDLASRLAGSSDLYDRDGRTPFTSINFITVHDGFTLRDLVSYENKHNEANGDDNRDGADWNDSANGGVEGPTEDAAINAWRAKQQRNFLATLFLSQGVPMLLGGDERGRSQHGNNNAYCQDSALTWHDWDLSAEQERLLDFTRGLIALRRAHPVLRQTEFLRGIRRPGTGLEDVIWLKLDGTAMEGPNWSDPQARSLGLRLAGDSPGVRDQAGRPARDDTVLILLNAYEGELPFVLPAAGSDADGWEVVLDTVSGVAPAGGAATFPVGATYPLAGGSVVVLRAAALSLPSQESRR